MKKFKDLGLVCVTVIISLIFVYPALAQEKDDSGKLTGKKIFNEKCVKCHSLDRPLSKTKDAAGWKMTVNRMKMKNPEWITDGDAKEIIHYLSSKSLFESKCKKCHQLNRPLSKKKDAAGWKMTVNRMKMKDPEWISDDDAAMITDYLATDLGQ